MSHSTDAEDAHWASEARRVRGREDLSKAKTLEEVLAELGGKPSKAGQR